MTAHQDELLQRSLTAIRTLRTELEQVRATGRQPIAVVGMACRFPGGADSPERFWELLEQGHDAVTEVPAERWPAQLYYSADPQAPGRMYTTSGGFLTEDIDAFDAGFFGISAQETARMDPQHRLLLETGWEALESGGLLTGQPESRRVGVFVGMSGSDHSRVPVPPRTAGPFTATGAAPSIAAGRIAHVLGLHGPALVVDTACSSSLVAVDLAVHSLRRGECDAALAGGVNLLLAPEPYVALCKMGALSPTGRCRTFDADADGYVRAEGCGLIALMRLSDARAVRAPVLAVIRGSAVNHDGRAGGVTVPSDRAQRELLRAALHAAGVDPHEVGYLETHGTGTPLGDPIEIRAATEVLCTGRPAAQPLVLGALKSAIGHLEAAAGIAGLIKAVLALQHGRIPGNLHLKTVNPQLGTAGLPVILPDHPMPWPTDGSPQIAGVSSFGFNGTNAHVVLEAAETIVHQRTDIGPRPQHTAHVLPLSAADPNALRDVTHRLADWIAAHPTADPADIAHTLGTRRHFAYRTTLVTAASGTELAAELRATAARALPDRPCRTGRHTALFLGADHAQATGHTAELYAGSLGFRAAYDTCVTELRAAVGQSAAALDPRMAPSALEPLQADLLCFTYQLALARMLADQWGVTPAAVGGRGPGQLAAACLAGIMDVPTAGAYLAARHGTGTSPTATLAPPRLRFLGGQDADGAQLTDPAFWLAGSREPEIARDCVRTMLAPLTDCGYGTFITVGSAREEPEDAPATAADVLWWTIAIACKPAGGQDPWSELLEGLASAYRTGTAVNWAEVHNGDQPARLALPTYPFQRARHAPPVPRADAFRAAALHRPDEETLRPTRPTTLSPVLSPLPSRQFETVLSRQLLPALADTGGVLHLGYYHDMLTDTACELFGAPSYELRDMAFVQALRFADERRTVQIVIDGEGESEGQTDSDGWLPFAVHSLIDGATRWTRHAQGHLRAQTSTPRPELREHDRRALLERLPAHTDGDHFYQGLRERGVALGESVMCVAEAWSGEGEALARLRPEAPGGQHPNTAASVASRLHPGVLDACAQLYALAAGERLPADAPFITTSMARFELDNTPGSEDEPLWVHFTLADPADPVDPAVGQHLVDLVGSYRLFDHEGRLLAQGDGAEVRVLTPDLLHNEAASNRAATVRTAADTSAPRRPDPTRRIRQATPEQRPDLLAEYLTDVLAALLPTGRVEISEHPLAALGLTSLAALELRRQLSADLGVDVPLDVLLDGPTVDELSLRLAGLPTFRATAEAVGGAGTSAGTGTSTGTSTGTGTGTANQEDSAALRSAPVSRDPARWLRHQRLTENPRVRLFCLPYGGRGASLFRTWAHGFPADIDVCPVQLPGREDRCQERLLDDCEEAVNLLAEALLPYTDRPFAFYGHSMGALLAYRLAHELGTVRGLPLRHLFVAAFTSPALGPNPLAAQVAEGFRALGYSDWPSAAELLDAFDGDTVRLRLAMRRFLGEEAGAQLLGVLEPVGCADLRIVHGYTHPLTDAAVMAPVTALHGRRDPLVTEEGMSSWSELSGGAFHLETFSGDHYFCHPDQDQAAVLSLLRAQLA